MIKKISVADLRPGMYIHELDCGWMQHPFLRSRFAIGGEEQIRKIAGAGIREVYIDTGRGDDVPEAPTRQEVETRLEAELAELGKAPAVASDASIEEEVREARRVLAEANRMIHDLMHDVRLGKQISLERTEPLVQKIAESILRNPGPLLALCRMKSKDEYTFMHSVSVGALMMLFCRAAGDGESVREAGLGGLLHDVGKMATPESILNKPGKLTAEEFAVMQTHVRAGLEMLAATPGIALTALNVIAQHHERMDGSGYPAMLKAESISRFGQMAAIVDVYDAITSDRVYHKGISSPEAMKKIIEWTRDHFDPRLVRIFVAAVGIYPIGTLVMLESGRLAVVTGHSDSQPLRPRVRVVYDTLKHSYVGPYDLDLARPTGHGGADRILRHEPPRKWSFNPLSYLGV